MSGEWSLLKHTAVIIYFLDYRLEAVCYMLEINLSEVYWTAGYTIQYNIRLLKDN